MTIFHISLLTEEDVLFWIEKRAQELGKLVLLKHLYRYTQQGKSLLCAERVGGQNLSELELYAKNGAHWFLEGFYQSLSDEALLLWHARFESDVLVEHFIDCFVEVYGIPTGENA